MLPIPYNSGNADDSSRLFYDLSTSKFHCLDLPETRGFKICGSSHGWFILCKNLELSLFNPITHAVISLPDFTAPPFPLGLPPSNVLDGELFFQNWDSDQYVMEHTTNVLYILKAILTSSPLDPSCLVFVHNMELWLLSFCKIGDDHWTVIEFEYHAPFKYYDFSDFTYSNNCLYTINGDGVLTMYNLNTPSRVMLNCSVPFEGLRDLVDRSSPEILLVVYVIPEDLESDTLYIVYKFSNGKEPKWIKVSDIGQSVLFVSGGQNAIILPSANLQLPGEQIACAIVRQRRITA